MQTLLLILALIVSILVPSGSWAQKATIQYEDFVIHSARAAVADGPSVPVDTSNTVSVEVNVISGTAEVLFRIAGAGRYGWTPLYCSSSDGLVTGTSTTVSGLFTCNVAGGNATNFRLDTCTACSVSTVVRRSTATIGGGSSGSGASSGWPLTRVGNITFANSFVNNAGIGNGTDYWALYRDATLGLQFNCVVSGVENACNYIRKLSSSFYFDIQNSSGVSLFRVTEAGVITRADEATIRKTADETVTSDITLQNDDVLLFPVVANATYSFRLFLRYSAATTGDLRFGFTLPAGAVGEKSSAHAPLTATSCVNTSTTTATNDITQTDPNVGGAGTGAGNICSLVVDGTVITAGTAGNVTLRWAQVASDVTATTVHANSWLTYRRIQ